MCGGGNRANERFSKQFFFYIINTCMQQSWLEIRHCFVVHLDHISVFAVLYSELMR